MEQKDKKVKRRFHLPNREWSKIIRFNGSDYLLKSLYDDDFDFDNEYKKDLDFDFDSEYLVQRKKIIKMLKKLQKREKRVDERDN